MSFDPVPPQPRSPITRRQMLRGSALAAVVAAVAGPVATAGAAPLGGYPPVPQPLKPLLDRLRLSSTQALTGVMVMMMPGEDRYSRQQRLTRPGPNPVDDGSPEQFVALVDRFIPQADTVFRPVAVALSVTLADAGFGHVQLPTDAAAAAVDRAVGVRSNDDTFPTALLAGLVLDVAAVLSGGSLGTGPFVSAFANADYTTKCRAFELIETPAASLVSVFDSALPQPLRGSASGVLRFLGGILLDGAAFTAWSEHRLYDYKTQKLSRRPAAWDFTRYRPEGITDGHDEFLGYYRGLKEF